MDTFSFFMRSLVGGIVAAAVVGAYIFFDAGWTETLLVAAGAFLATAGIGDA